MGKAWGGIGIGWRGAKRKKMEDICNIVDSKKKKKKKRAVDIHYNIDEC